MGSFCKKCRTIHLFSISGLDKITKLGFQEDVDSEYGLADDVSDWFCSCNLDNYKVFPQYESKRGAEHVRMF